ncbi:diaminopimelate decarboxylase [Streptacidiphilus sp. BW17]|uniref:diaminopimelate decarboxylase family protein n=1 Tax=unclassified Streptacidiphilus TaxID=2643834 RepID=UPI003513E439
MNDTVPKKAFALAETHGTPLFCYSATRLADATRAFRVFTDGLPLPTETYYSYKTNYLPRLCEDLASMGIGAEVTSLHEWRLARSLHQPSSILVNGIGKAAGLLRAALDGEPPRLINIETDSEIDILCTRPPAAPPVRVGLRIRVPGLTGETGADPTEGWQRGETKFGWSSTGEAILAAAKRLAASDNVILEALHLHLGGQLVAATTFERALAGVCALLDRLAALDISVTSLDLGGGLASGWVEKRRKGPLLQLAQTLGVLMQPAVQKAPDLAGITAVVTDYAARLRMRGVEQLLFEPGRYLAEPALSAVASVVAVRHDDDRNTAVLDIGTNALHCWRGDETRPVHIGRVPIQAELTYELVGPLCHRSDTFGRVTVPGPLTPGTLIGLDAVGAYSLGDWIANAWDRPGVFHLEEAMPLWHPQAPAEIFQAPMDPVAPQRIL